MAEFEFNAVLGAIGAYYGTGSDQWVEFAKYGLTADNLYDTLKHVPDVNIITSNSGKVLGATVSKNFSGVSSGIAGSMDSNIQVPSQGSGTTYSGKIPMNGSYNQTTGQVEMSSGAKAASGGATVATVLDKVALGVAGVSLGAKLGAFIDSALYAANPSWWDDHFPSINPETWNSIAKTEGGKNFLSSLLGVSKVNDKNTGTMYLDEDAVAYLAYAMKQSGFFDEGAQEVTAYDDSLGTLAHPNSYPPLPIGGGGNYEIAAGSQSSKIYQSEAGAAEYAVFILLTNGGYVSNWPVYLSRTPFTARRRRKDESWTTLPVTTYTISGQTFYATALPNNFTYTLAEMVSSNIPVPLSVPSTGDCSVRDMLKLVYGGTISGGQTVDGVSKQPGATFPNTSGWNDPASTLQSLKTQYPDMWSGAVTMDVPQPDGTTQRYTYVPVPITGTNGADDSDPTNTTVTQGGTGTVNDSSTTDLINTLIRYITQTKTESPTESPTPTDTPNPDPTGDGTTPPVVAPTGQASALFAVYNPSQAALNSFGAWLWSSNFIDQVLKLFNNPMQSIIGLHKIFAAPPISGSGTIRVGYLDSGVGSNLVGSQYVTVNCGTVNVREQFGNVFDYTDTHIRLYLPFIGIVPLDTADVMRGSVTVVYHVDVITGACLAEVKVSRDSGGGTLYQYAGDAAVRYPISSGSYMGVVSGVLGVVGGIASAVMTGGASAPLAAGAVASGIANAKTDVQHSGSFAGNAGAMGGKKPYLIIERPQTSIANGYSAYQGVGANTVKKVGSMSGYFKMTDVHVDNVARASAEELEQIRTMIERGVIQ